MDLSSFPVQVIDSLSGEPLDTTFFPDIPHPGQPIEVVGHPYTVLEKRHSYQLRDGRYRLAAIRIWVQPGMPLLGLGDLSCGYNAQSPLLRCAVHPLGPCEGCPDYLPGGSD